MTGYQNELEGLSEQACQKVDLHVSDQLTHFLFSNNEVREFLVFSKTTWFSKLYTQN